MRISIIVAMDASGLIGRDGDLPWRLPADLRRFRRITMGKPVVMGRRTLESLGKPLDGRLNIVLTRRGDYAPEGASVAHSLDEALAMARKDLDATGEDEVMILGGASLFAEVLPRADRLYLTRVEGAFEGDTYFPQDRLEADDWVVVSDEAHPADARNPHPHRFQVLERRPR